MHTDAFQTLTSDLRDLGGRRVWSLMVSLFGDLVRAEGQSIDGPLLSEMMTILRVKPEASRVALHRLRNDDWIKSEKTGRISRHALTEKGRALSALASPRIYADACLDATRWQLVMTPDNGPNLQSEMALLGFTALQPRLYAGPAEIAAPKGALCLPSTNAPDWLRAQVEPALEQGGYINLLTTLIDFHKNLPHPRDLSPLQTAVLRCLIVHNWRRLVLKHPVLPAPLVDHNGPAHLCHIHVADLLNRFERPQLDQLEQASATA